MTRQSGTHTIGFATLVERLATCTSPRCRRCPHVGHGMKWYLRGVPGASKDIYLGASSDGWEDRAASECRRVLRGAQMSTLVAIPKASTRRKPFVATATGRKRFTLYKLRRKGLIECIEQNADETHWRRTSKGDWWVDFLRKHGGYGIRP